MRINTCVNALISVACALSVFCSRAEGQEKPSCKFLAETISRLEKDIDERKFLLANPAEGRARRENVQENHLPDLSPARSVDCHARTVNELALDMERDLVLTRLFLSVAIAKLQYVENNVSGACSDHGGRNLRCMLQDAENITVAIPDSVLESSDRAVVRSLESMHRKLLLAMILARRDQPQFASTFTQQPSAATIVVPQRRGRARRLQPMYSVPAAQPSYGCYPASPTCPPYATFGACPSNGTCPGCCP